MTEPHVQEAYSRGFAAAQCGEQAASCPYPYESVEGEAWVKGFTEGGGTD